MINGEKIGVGIVTCNREQLFKKCYNSISNCEYVDFLCISEDSTIDYRESGGKNTTSYIKKYIPEFNGKIWLCVSNINIGVGKSKNVCIEKLLNEGCEHIFIIEEDIFIKDPDVFEKYINASKASGIQHFNFSQHGRMNKTINGEPNPKLNIRYGEEIVALYPHCVGAFSYYSRKCLDSVGLLDEEYFNACEHVDHTYEIIKAGMHPPFWYFADIDLSWEYLGDEEWSIEKSTISSHPNHQQMMKDADRIFVKKHGHYPGQTPLVDYDELGKRLKNIKNNYASV